MAPAYKLTYFDVKAAAEPIRFLFSYGGIEFEDVRVSREDWLKIKDTTPFGQLPILEYKGKVVNQSVSLCRYVAKQVGLAGKDDWENLEIDSIVDTIMDYRQKIFGIFRESDEEKKKVLVEQFKGETVPYYLTRFEALIKKNKGYLSSGRLTWADVFFAALTEFTPEFLGGDLLDGYPGLKALRKTVLESPNIKKWLDKRPKN